MTCRQKCNRYGGGVALFASDIYEYVMVNSLSYLDLSIECVSANVLITNMNIVIICIYRPRSGNINNYKLTKLLSLASNTNHQGIHIIGDINLDLLKHASKTHVYEFINIMYYLSMSPLINY